MSKNFQELLAALNATASETDELAKALPQIDPEAGPGPDDEEEEDDEAIQAAAAEAAAAGAGKKPMKPPMMAKSLQVMNDDGTQDEAIDATELVKSLIDRQDTTDGTLAKAMEAFTGIIQKQGELIKSLSTQVGTLAAQGRGRKAVLNVTEKPDAGTMAKSQQEPQGLTPDVFFAKANAAFDAGKISGKDLNVISVCLRGNHSIEPSLVSKVISAA